MTPTSPAQALIALCQELGIEAQVPEGNQDMTVNLQFDDGPAVVLAAEDEALIIFAQLGEAPEHATGLMETLLSANLFWRDTAGATLSLEPDTRAVLMAQRLPEAALRDTAVLRLAVDRFAMMLNSWTEVVQEWTQLSTTPLLPPEMGQRI